MHYVYLIENESGELYYGCTGDLRKRLDRHNHGHSESTKGHKWRIVYYEAYSAEADAWEREKQLKQYGQSLSHLKRRIKHSLSAK